MPTKPSSENPTTLLFRGVHARHPAIDAARKGLVVPGDANGTVTPEQHNRGGVSENSPYTSWTFDREIAESHADDYGRDGVILKLPLTDPEPSDTWSWETSPDLLDEQEILLRGYRSGATVELL
jgi:hypothetical protein